MSFHNITARLIENRIEVATSGNRYTVFRHDDAKGNGSCPIKFHSSQPATKE